MFDIGFSELLLVFVIGLIVLGPQRLPVAVKTVVGWIRTLRSLATTVQNELAQELKLQEFQESLKKVEKASLNNLTPELKASMDELREAAESMKRSYSAHDPEKASDEANTILNPVVKGSEAQRQVGRELDALVAAAQGGRQRAHRQRLGQARHALDQQVALREHGHHHAFEEAVLPDDDTLDLVEDALHQLGGLGGDGGNSAHRSLGRWKSGGRGKRSPRNRLAGPLAAPP